MKQEPICWVDERELNPIWFDCYGENDVVLYRENDETIQRDYKLIPLYTSPHHDSDVKQYRELSDAEIQNISHKYHYSDNPDYIGFAKAILERAKQK